MAEQVVAVHLYIDQEYENAVDEKKIRKGRTDDQPAEVQLREVIFQHVLFGIVGCDAQFLLRKFWMKKICFLPWFQNEDLIQGRRSISETGGIEIVV
jgi:hypothetical protein